MLETKEMNLLTEDLMSLKEASKTLPKRPHISTVWRWAERGVRGNKLETLLLGGKRFTSAQALTRFIAATQR